MQRNSKMTTANDLLRLIPRTSGCPEAKAASRVYVTSAMTMYERATDTRHRPDQSSDPFEHAPELEITVTHWECRDRVR